MAQTLISALQWWSRETPDHVALRVADTAVTFAELDRWTARVAAWLRDDGVQPGDRVGTIAGTSLAHCALLIGSVRAGAIASPLSPRLSARETIEFCEDTAPRWVLTDADQAGKHEGLNAIGCRTATLAPIAALRDGGGPAFTADAAPDDAVVIIATSGSTARPKGVVYTHRSMLAYAQEFAIEEPFIGSSARILALPPLSTSGGFVQLMEFMVLGATARFESGFDAERALKLLQDERINAFQGVPLFFERIAACEGFAAADLSELKFTSVGGAPVSRALLDIWQQKGCLLRQIYGQTEAGGAISIMSKQDAAQHPEKAGRGGMFTELRVVDPEGRSLPPNELGQILIRGPSVMKEYWNNPEATAKTLIDGWLHTGDLGRIDENGNLSFVDRMKDIIISGGLNISAAEVERVVAGFDGVFEVAVIGAADAKFGETPLAIIHSTLPLQIEQIVAHCNRNLADYKVPRYIVVEAEPLPRLPTGKIAKPALRARFAALLPNLPRVR
ncbi:class I adenylate-forming enzyme family protein [Solimonas terrae]|uniref:Long-chain fatty acid--CoA ligase n=1 Tax=Solimonas terrae TaxID=1396819 RepID=A0A6M2BQ30_9GAMM|nr:AMP-binding protein [Solimonas terrae]NGY04331.1 long-chain fatty acid--CoA ligase [Solimonas terrae]